MYRKMRKQYIKLLNAKKSAFRNNIFQMLDNIESKDHKGFRVNRAYMKNYDKKKSVQTQFHQNNGGIIVLP